MKRLSIVLIVFSLFVALGAPSMASMHCMDELGCVRGRGRTTPIVVGAMLSVSGATSFYGEDSLGGIEIAISNRDGMLLGREITLVVEDSLCTAEGGQAAAQRMARRRDNRWHHRHDLLRRGAGRHADHQRSGHVDDIVIEYFAQVDRRRRRCRRNLLPRLLPHRA